MSTVGVNPPRTPVTRGSNGVAAATLPNMCKMPGPPAPFILTPLPNIGRSGDSPNGYSVTVQFDGEPVAIQGASFGSKGDVASKGTGGGVTSMNVEGPTKFISPGSLDVMVEGKNVQLLSDLMLNNCGVGGSPPNSATMGGLLQEAKEKNPSGSDVCGPGNHSERVHYPDVPKDEWHPRKRLEAMKKVAATEEDEFEIKAAEHNIREEHITHGRQLSRKISRDEKKAGMHEDDQKIWIVCTVCGYRREADQAPDRNSTVEAKSTEDAVSGGTQKANNRTLVNQGKSVTYKAPRLNRQKIDALKADGFGYIPIT